MVVGGALPVYLFGFVDITYALLTLASHHYFHASFIGMCPVHFVVHLCYCSPGLQSSTWYKLLSFQNKIKSQPDIISKKLRKSLWPTCQGGQLPDFITVSKHQSQSSYLQGPYNLQLESTNALCHEKNQPSSQREAIMASFGGIGKFD